MKRNSPRPPTPLQPDETGPWIDLMGDQLTPARLSAYRRKAHRAGLTLNDWIDAALKAAANLSRPLDRSLKTGPASFANWRK